MSTPRFQHKYRIPSARHPWHEYNGGLYFITICTKNRECYFGEIARRDVARRVSTNDKSNVHSDDVHIVSTNDKSNDHSDDVHIVSTDDEPTMNFTEIGKYAVENLEQIKTHYPYCEIPVFVVMPNHIHAVVVIDDGNGDGDGDGDGRDAARHVSTETNDKPKTKQQIAQNRGLLSVVMGGFKSAITRYANQNNIQFAWQSRFHDRIIRNQDECNRIATYIENNPMNWQNDELYS